MRRAKSGPAALPGAFREAALRWLGDETAAFLHACARPPALAIRANSLKGGLDALHRALETLAPGDETWPRVPWWPGAVLPPSAVAAVLAGHPLARIGALYAQDPAALAAVAALDPRPGEFILDLCAAPGGKSTAIADRLAGHGVLVANDIDVGRARDLGHTLERWGATTCAVLALTPERVAGLAPGLFDRVLVDAPCSGEAMFARHDRAAADWSWEHVAGCATRQRRLLGAARSLVRPGGILVYATCTFNPFENEGVIAHHLAAFPADVLEDARTDIPGSAPGRPDLLQEQPAASPGAALDRCARLWPHRIPGAGHFIARLRVAGNGTTTRSRAADSRGRLSHQQMADRGDVLALLERVAPRMAITDSLEIRGDHAYRVPPGLPAALSAAALVPGLEVAERRGRTWRPAHALALAVRPEQAAGTVDLDAGRARLFLSGQPSNTGATMDDDPLLATWHGLLLATWQGYPLGWARARGETLMPLLPKGVRGPVG